MRPIRTALMLALATGSARAEAPAATPDWAVEGQWVDTCDCQMPCPCWKDEKPSHGSCRDLTYFHVEKGHYGAVKLDGLDVVGVTLAPDGKKMSESTAAKANLLVNLYVSKALPAAVAQAAEAIFSEHVAVTPLTSAAKHAVKKVEMKASLGEAGARVTIPKILELDVKRTKKPFGSDTTVVPFSSASVEGRQDRYDFSDDGQSWKLKQHSASFATFSWSSAKEKAAAAPKK
jgi:hypothetical protein